MSESKEALIQFSERQTMAWERLQDPSIISLLYGGAKGGGKSQFGCYWIYLMCLDLIDRYKLTATKFPPPVAFMGRKQSVDLSDTTLETWKAIIPADHYVLKSAEKEIIIKDAVKIQYGGFDDSDTVKKFNSAEYVYGFIDQAEEVSRDDYGLFKGTLRRKINGNEPDYKILMTANPAICWLKDEFIINRQPENAFIQALPSDNPFLAKGYVDRLKDAFKHRPELLRAYIDGDWDVLSGADIAIKAHWVTRAVKRELRTIQGKVVVACDPSRYGDDETVIYVLRDGAVIDQLIMGDKSLMETAGHLVALKTKYSAKLIAIDSNGIGAGICDRLKEMREPVLEVNVGQRATTDELALRYYNRRAEVIWEGAELFINDQVSIPDDPILIAQLSNIKYKMESSGKIKIESKDDIKVRAGGKSPDRADAFLIGLHALKYIPDQVNDFNRVRIAPPAQRSDYGWNRSFEYAGR